MTEAIKLMIGTPCFGGQLSTLYFASMFNLQSALRAYPNVEMTVQLRDGDALITRARANVVAAFLDDPKTTHLLFIDADIGFEPDQVLRLLSSGADVVAGTYPIKRINWDKVHKVIGTGKPNTRSAALDYVLEMKNPNHIAAVKGFARMRYAGTGFLMIKRHVLEKMCQYYQSLQFCRRACEQSESFRSVRMHSRPGNQNLPQRRLQFLQALDGYGWRNLGRPRKPSQSRGPSHILWGCCDTVLFH